MGRHEMRAATMSDGVLRLAEGRRLRYATLGPPDGRPLVLHHGSPSSRLQRVWPPTFCADHDVFLVTYDRPGYGRSDPQPGRRVLDTAADVAALADHIGLDRFAVLGGSGGGPHALACTAALGSRLRRTAVVAGVAPATMTGFLEGMMAFNRGQWIAARQGAQAHADYVTELAGLLQHDPAAFLARLSAEMAADDQRQLARLQADPARYRANLENFAEAGRQGARGWIDDMVAMASDWGFRLEDVAGEVRVWHGRADRNVPAGHGEYLAAHLPNATLRWFEDAAAGHATMDLLHLVIDDLLAA
jgi:pimeloyl-ACP methyl ester carboxylesterase